MTRFRSLALSITLTLLVTGCYTQLRAPHASSHHRDFQNPPRRTHVWRHHAPVFHIPTYSHYDGWMYGDSYCDIWVDRYYDYHPWLPRHGVHVFFDVYAHPGRDVWRGNRYGRYHRRNGRDYYGGYQPQRGPRFEPLSPTIEVAIDVVEHRGRFRRSGFAGGVPGRGEDIVTMRGSGLSDNEGSDGRESTQTVRVTRPSKIRRTLLAPVVVAGKTYEGLLNQEITWESWQGRRRTPTSPDETRKGEASRWGDAGRDLQALGPATEVDERPARQPKPQTNWFNPNNDSENMSPGATVGNDGASGRTNKPDRTEKRERAWGRSETEKGVTSTSEPIERRTESTTPDLSSGATVKRSAPASDYASPKKENEDKGERLRRDRDRDASSSRRDASPRPEVRDPKPASQSWATKESKREKPKPNYAAPPKEQRKKERVSRSSEGKKSERKETKKKEEEKKETREEKRKKTRKRRGM